MSKVFKSIKKVVKTVAAPVASYFTGGLSNSLFQSTQTSGSSGGFLSTIGSILGGVGGFMNNNPQLLTGLANYFGQKQTNRQMKSAAERADPFAKMRPEYQARLRSLNEDPNAFLKNDPQYQAQIAAGTNLATRRAAKLGLRRSGSILQELQEFGTRTAATRLNERERLLASLSGGDVGPGTGAQILANRPSTIAGAGGMFANPQGQTLIQ